MIISKLEIERFIEAYKDYKESDDSTIWLANRNYLENNNLYSASNIIESLVDFGADLDTIAKALVVLGVEVV